MLNVVMLNVVMLSVVATTIQVLKIGNYYFFNFFCNDAALHCPGLDVLNFIFIRQ
jgi:hypothetical protein